MVTMDYSQNSPFNQRESDWINKGPALLSGGRSWGFLGDSITHRSTAAAGRAFVDIVPWMVGTASMAPTGAFVPVPGAVTSVEAGVPGEQTYQMLLRTDDLIATGINGMVLLGGTNDAGQATSVTVAAYIANIDAIAKKCRKAGIPLVVGTVPPRASSVAAYIHKSIVAYNLALRQWAPKAGVYLADTYSTLVDVATGYLLAAYDSGDGTHPNTLGHYQLSTAFTAAIKKSLITQTMTTGAKSPASIVANPLFIANSTGWYEQPGGTGTAPAYSLVADATGRLPVGAQWYEMDFTATAGGTRTMATAPGTAGWAIGDILLLTASIDVVDVSGYAAAAKLDPSTASYKIQILNQAAVSVSNYLNPALPIAPGEIAVLMQVPAGMTDILLWFSCTLPTGAHAKFRLSAVDIKNITALGITGY